MKTAACVLAGCVGAWTAFAAARQEPPPQFRTGVEAMQIDVSVLDDARRPVRGLTAADFTVLEDGKPRPIVAFQAVDLPSTPDGPAAGVAAIPPDVTRNDLPDGRTVVLMIDPFLERIMVEGRVTIADPAGVAALRATAQKILDSLGPGDLAAVVHTVYGVAQNLTTDRTRLKRAVESSPFGTIKRADGEDWGSCECGTCRVDAITSVATALGAETQRRKVIFFIGEQLKLAPTTGRCNDYLEPATKRLIQATQRAHVNVHTVDPNGLETTNVHAGDDFRANGSISAAARAQERANREQLIERQQSLQTVADWTGGRAVLNTNVPEASVRPILEESSAYYLLAFQRPGPADGRFHPITVTVNRPGVQVRTRRGYYADPGAATGNDTVSLDVLSRGLLPERGLPMSVAAAPFLGRDGRPVVLLVTGIRGGPEGTNRASSPGGAPMFDPIEILTSAFRDGKKDVEWQRQRLAVAIPDTPPGQLSFEATSTVSVAPGSYELRVATRHQRTGRVGSVHMFVDVPDFSSERLTLSGVVLHDPHAPLATPVEALEGIVDMAPTTRRSFTSADRITALVRIYRRATDKPGAASAVFRILNAGLEEVTAGEVAVPAEQFAGPAADARFALPLATLPAGAYLLRVEASGHGGNSRRDVPFTVR